MATKAAFRRLTKEYMELQKNPPPYIVARPVENNILEWHYVIQGPPDTPYQGGEYYGRLTFPSDYPYKPPAIRMSTPSGRFQTDTRLCLTMSDFHPSLWNPSWSVATILNGLLSFMTTDENTTGSIRTTDAEKRIYALRSHRANLKMVKFRDVFPDLCTVDNSTLDEEILRRRKATNKQQEHLSSNATNSTLTTVQKGPEETNAITRTVSRWRRWVLVLVVFIYLILSKIASRSSSSDSM
ncbi:ubiquitin-conjugating enzyme/RWD-like protein [Halteromyces radiatus]|uniref:ubiquitin-conjugating enzyme/RWD-like protein n=1 Tax=Halteromyces radiatus TaxID=101107 RepID=UPI00221FFFEE|nr:ubiquitin-conjugating enzyme/RWD-like protein [Halteromyces radiatus]KAI8099112.1 ubiquitin-conjugating enzyme/RWD-like protein [Halteromyces radiatus]